MKYEGRTQCSFVERWRNAKPYELTMDKRRFWPFDVVKAYEGFDRVVTFFETATQEGHKAYWADGGVPGAVAMSGQVAEAIPRSGIDRGLRRYWEVLLCRDYSHREDSFFYRWI